MFTRIIEETGRVPVERDTLYREVRREQGTWQLAGDLQPTLSA